jgi:catechol 2,3-dioxygenase-like lactoylglutathione lyase family enzyme
MVTKLENTIPVLGVSDVNTSIRFYTETLGFDLDWGGGESTVCSVSRDGHSVMLAEFAKPGSWVWIGLTDDALFDAIREEGVEVLQGPKNYSWAYEMKFADPDGNVLWFGTEPKDDLPTEQ